MAGTLVLTTLSDGTNSTSATNAIQGSAKAWVNFTGSNGTINASYNVSSVTRTSTGYYTINFTNALADANYCITTALKPTSGASGTNGKIANVRYDNTPTTSAFQIFTNSTGGAEDMDRVYASVFD